MHTHDNEVQFAVTTTAGTTGVEKKNKDTSGGATKSLRIRRDMSFPNSYPKMRVVGGTEGSTVCGS